MTTSVKDAAVADPPSRRFRPAPARLNRFGTQSTWIWRSCWIAFVAGGLALKSLLSPAYAFGSGDDDELMVRMAKGFLDGHWSSSWAQTGPATLVKPVGYPLFLAATHYLPWSPLLTAYAIYLVGAVLIAWAWRRLSASRPQATIVLAALTFNPIAFTLANQRVYRDYFTDAVATVVIGAVFVMAALVQSSSTRALRGSPDASDDSRNHRNATVVTLVRASAPFVLAVPVGIGIGVAAITKATWVWLPVASIAPLAFPLAARLHRRRHLLAAAGRLALAGLLAIGSAFAVVETTKLMNKHAYGVALVDEFSTGSFARTWAEWASVDAGRPRPFVQITHAMRLAVYRVSPAAAEMKPFLESPSDTWKAVDCQSSLHICDESGNWFQWDLLSAAVSTGKVNSVLEVQNYFTRVADDIAAACDRHALRCSSSPVLGTGLPTLGRISLSSWASDTTDGMWQATVGSLPIGAPNQTRPTDAQYRLWSSVVPGMPPIDQVGSGTTASGVYSLLGVMDVLYRAFNGLLVLVLGAGVAVWVVCLVCKRPRPWTRSARHAGVTSLLFLVSWALGMALLAIFQAALGQGGYVSPLYWSDFATPAELCIVMAAFAAWPAFRRRPAGSHARHSSL